MRIWAAIAVILLLASALCLGACIFAGVQPYFYQIHSSRNWNASIRGGRLGIGIRLSGTDKIPTAGSFSFTYSATVTQGWGLVARRRMRVRSPVGPEQWEEFWLPLGRWAIVLAAGGMGCLLWRRILSKRRGFPVGAVEQRHD